MKSIAMIAAILILAGTIAYSGHAAQPVPAVNQTKWEYASLHVFRVQDAEILRIDFQSPELSREYNWSGDDKVWQQVAKDLGTGDHKPISFSGHYTQFDALNAAGGSGWELV